MQQGLHVEIKEKRGAAILLYNKSPLVGYDFLCSAFPRPFISN